MNFGLIDSYVLFGGGPLVLASADKVTAEGARCAVFTGARHLEEIVEDDLTLARALERRGVPGFEVADINAEPRLAEHVTPTTLGFALGPAWIFGPEVCALFGERFVNFMGIDLPRFRGGAHHTWQILMDDRVGSVNLQLIKPVVDSGAVIKRLQFDYPAGTRVPADYFAAAEPVNRAFIAEFLDEVGAGADFAELVLDEAQAQHFPYLSTDNQGWVDWSWSAPDVVRFVNAFGEPYRGASTTYEGRRVRLKDATLATGEGPFHPFMAGLVYRVGPEGAWVCAPGGSVLVADLREEEGGRLDTRVGRRFNTPSPTLDMAMAYRAVYTADGLRQAPPA